MKKLVVLSGAGMSAESGLATFRGAGGLWEGHKIEEVATPQAWHDNPELVLEFYNQRRRKLKLCDPNAAHLALAKAENRLSVTVITQNVDDLHERAGSSAVMHLHGELLKARSSIYEKDIYPWPDDLHLGDKCKRGHQLRPHIVWFGEAVPMMMEASVLVSNADVVIVVGTSLNVYPAAGLLNFAHESCQIIYVDPNPATVALPVTEITTIPEVATTGVQKALSHI
ncbi:MAG: NAD-dependent deacylase [Saprospiraceae bacterium]|nr:NAD-dependent deacylase [Saprospiraceae bacterium]